MIKVSDYIFQRLQNHYKVKHVFMISGGGAMHLNDSLGKCKEIKYICNHHEQASAIAAEGYARTSGQLAVVNVTTGPGGTNAITGLIGQWLDSVPVLYLSGQVKFETTIASCPKIGLRQLGDQEINIIDIVKPVTKFAKMITNPLEIKKALDKAIYLATHGRPGPVWLDIPLNIQSALIDEKNLLEYNEKEDQIKWDFKKISKQISKSIELIKQSKRPVIIAGNGIHLAKAENLFLDLIKELRIPVLSTFNAVDLIETAHPLFIGRIGTVGDRAGNFALQNADLILSLGSRNNIRQVSYNWENYAHRAKKIIIDIDPAELKKPTVKPDLGINCDIKDYILEFSKQLIKTQIPDYTHWIQWTNERKMKYPVVLEEYKTSKNKVQPYFFVHELSKNLKEGAVVIGGNGTACVTLFQSSIIKNNQRVFWNSGCASMGYDLPAAIGASIAKNNQEVICLAGDGSVMMNLQELATMQYYQLPIKLFILNNDGYISIKQTQENFFESRFTGCDDKSGVGFPDFIKVAAAFGISTEVISNHSEMEHKIKAVLESKKPVVCEVKLQTDYKFSPKLSSEKLPDGRMISKPLEDMFPFLDKEEFQKNMIQD